MQQLLFFYNRYQFIEADFHYGFCFAKIRQYFIGVHKKNLQLFVLFRQLIHELLFVEAVGFPANPLYPVTVGGVFKVSGANGKAGLEGNSGQCFSWRFAVRRFWLQGFLFGSQIWFISRNYLVKYFVGPNKNRLSGFEQLLNSLATFEVLGLWKGKAGFYVLFGTQ